MTNQWRNRSGVARVASSALVVCLATGFGTAQTRDARRDAPPRRSESDGSAVPGGEQAEKPGSEEPSESPRIVVVVSKDNPLESLEIDGLRRIFLRKKTQWNDGTSIKVYERSVDYPIRVAFSKRVFQKEPSELTEYWMNLQLTRGLKPPKVLRSAKLVKRYLQRVRGGIGYLYENEVDDTVKVIEIRDREHD